MKGFDCLLSIEGIAVGAQINADLARGSQTSDITNMIKLDWQDSLVHTKWWRVTCNGAYVLDDAGLKALEEAFLAGSQVSVLLKAPGLKYSGKGVIINFPVGAQYNQALTYNIQIQGTGELKQELEIPPEEIGHFLNV